MDNSLTTRCSFVVECKADTLSDVSSSPGLSKSFLGFLRGFDSSDVIRIYNKSLIKLRPLTSYATGPQPISIFTPLEKEFRKANPMVANLMRQ